ncbi:MAG: hypothetical protein ACRD7E_19900 [Bryobacteraceae bacterium]
MAGKVKQLLVHVLPGVLKPIRVLWNEVIGFVFLALAAWASLSVYRNWRESAGDGDSLVKILLSALFVVLMAGFGISSFLRARKISRS